MSIDGGFTPIHTFETGSWSGTVSAIHPGDSTDLQVDSFISSSSTGINDTRSGRIQFDVRSTLSSDSQGLAAGFDFAGTHVDPGVSGGGTVDITSYDKGCIAFCWSMLKLHAGSVSDMTDDAGIFVALGSDGSTMADREEWVIGGRDWDDTLTWQVAAIDPLATAVTATIPGAVTAKSGSFDETAIDYVEFGITPDSSSQNLNRNLALDAVGILARARIVGTSVDFDELTSDASTNNHRFYQAQSDGQIICHGAIGAGNGGATQTTFTGSDPISVVFAPQASGTTRGCHYRDNHFGFKADLDFTADGTQDSFNRSNVNITSTSPCHYEEVFTGTNPGSPDAWYVGLKGGAVTLDTGTTHDDWTFNDCGLVDCTVGAVDLNNVSFRGAGVSAADVPVGVAIDDFSNVVGCKFRNYDDTGQVALQIDGTGPKSVTLDACIFSGNTVDIDWAGTGQLTITVVNGGTGFGSLTITTSGGGTVVSGTVTTWTLEHTDGTELPDGTRYRIVDSVDGELYNATVSGASGFSFTDTTLTAGRTLTLYVTYQNGTVVRQGGPWPLIVPTGGGTMSWTANTTTVDSVAATYAIDGSTVTEFSTDYANVQCDIDDVDGETTHKRAYAWMRYIQTTELGIRNWWGIVTAQDAANIIYNGDVVDLEFNNDNAATANLKFTDEDIYVSKSGGSVDLWGEGITAFAGKVYLRDVGNVSQDTLNSIETKVNTISSNVTGVDGKVDTLDTVADSILENQKARKDLDPSDGKIKWRNSSGTVILEADAYEDVDGTTAYNANSTKVARTDYMTAP